MFLLQNKGRGHKLALLLITAVILIPALVSADPYVPDAPALPRFMADTVVIGRGELAARATTYRDAQGPDATPEDFLFAYLPGRLFAQLLHQEPTDLAAINGLLYLSGHEGGVWLNSVMNSNIGPGKAMRRLRGLALWLLDARLSRRARLVETGSVAAKRRALNQAFDTLILSYGYNRGYLLEVLEHPPRGGELAPGYVSCQGLLQCSFPMDDVPALEPLLPVRQQLTNPPSPAWRELSSRLDEQLPEAIARGEGVWVDLMSERQFQPDGYQALVDVSAEYLMINEAVLLMSARALAEGNEDDLDRALLADAALTVWLGSYMIGLSAE